jgi:hypothetical protein
VMSMPVGYRHVPACSRARQAFRGALHDELKSGRHSKKQTISGTAGVRAKYVLMNAAGIFLSGSPVKLAGSSCVCCKEPL